MNALPRWLISITDMPLPRQSSISSAAWRSTGSGSAAGPAPKLKTRGIERPYESNRMLAGGRSEPGSGVAEDNAPVLYRRAGRVARRLSLVFLRLDDLLETGEPLAVVEVDQPHPLGRSALLPHLGDARADQDSAGGDEHDPVLGIHQLGRDQLAVAFAAFNRDYSLRPAPMPGVLRKRRTFAKAVFGRRQHRLALVGRRQQRDDALAGLQLHPPHAGRTAAHGPHLVFREAHCLAGIGEQHYVLLAVGQRHPDQIVPVFETHGDDALGHGA